MNFNKVRDEVKKEKNAAINYLTQQCNCYTSILF